MPLNENGTHQVNENSENLNFFSGFDKYSQSLTGNSKVFPSSCECHLKKRDLKRNAWACEHKSDPHYSKGLCKTCYHNNYYK